MGGIAHGSLSGLSPSPSSTPVANAPNISSKLFFLQHFSRSMTKGALTSALSGDPGGQAGANRVPSPSVESDLVVEALAESVKVLETGTG